MKWSCANFWGVLAKQFIEHSRFIFICRICFTSLLRGASFSSRLQFSICRRVDGELVLRFAKSSRGLSGCFAGASVA
jgi:hypothetical protein